MRYSYKLLLEGLGARLKKLRKERGWTLENMVVQHDYHLSQWQGFETGKRGISVQSLLRIADIFDVTLCDLLKGLGEVPEANTVQQPPSTKRLDSHTQQKAV